MGGKYLQIKDQQYFDKISRLDVFPLHIHWDGSVMPADLFRISQEKGIQLMKPERNIRGIPIIYKSRDNRLIKSEQDIQDVYDNWRKYDLTDVFRLTTDLMQTEESLIDMAVAHSKYLKSINASYAEVRFAPQYLTKKGLTYEQVIGYSLEGFAKGKEETGVDARLIISIGREAAPDTGIKVVEAALQFEGDVLGIDLACDELHNPPEKHLKAFEMTLETELKRTVHAGEMCDILTNLNNIFDSITILQAQGLGHAIHLSRNDCLIDFVKHKGIRIESNPISNYESFGYDIENLMLDKLVNEGVLITINPDDPALFRGQGMAHNLYHLGKMYGHEFVEKVIQNSIDSAWGLSNDQKSEFKSRIK